MRYATNGCIAFARCRAILAQDEPSPIPKNQRIAEVRIVMPTSSPIMELRQFRMTTAKILPIRKCMGVCRDEENPKETVMA